MKVFTHTLPFSQNTNDLLNIFKDEEKLFLLDSSLHQGQEGRYSFLGFSPFGTIKAESLKKLRKELKPFLGLKSPWKFPAGAVGYLAYDGELYFALYEGLICVDHFKQELIITSTGLPYADAPQRRTAAKQKIEYILFQLHNHRVQTRFCREPKGRLNIKSNFTAKQYMNAVRKALEHIHDGDIYQINLSQRMDVLIKNWRQYVHPVDLYQQLRDFSPSMFSAYLDAGEQIILSSSPERFLSLAGTRVQVQPMKGTRPRGETPQEDRKFRQELIDSAKEKAELLMVTDLERNDLGRVCQYGTVKVKSMRDIEEYSTVFQATSIVEGQLHPKFDQFDLLRSAFPSGSVTGCPKIEAMKIIAKLERSRRGLYTGALGYISFTGNMDFNVLIRTLFLEQDRISFHVGGGIVADSDPKKEYEETLIKAKAMVETLRKVF